MKFNINEVYKNQTFLYRLLLFALTTFLIVYIFPKRVQFKYDYQIGKPWSYESLYAPFDFAVQKTSEEMAKEKERVTSEASDYFFVKPEVAEVVQGKLLEQLSLMIDNEVDYKKALKVSQTLLGQFYRVGYLDPASELDEKLNESEGKILLRAGNEVSTYNYMELLLAKDLMSELQNALASEAHDAYRITLFEIFTEVLQPNVFYDKEFSQKSLNQALSNVSFTEGFISKNELIVAKESIVDAEIFRVLESLKSDFTVRIGDNKNHIIIVSGYIMVVILLLALLFLYFRHFERLVFEEASKLSFILFNLVFFISAVLLTLRYAADFIYMVPLTVVPIVMKSFFKTRLALVVHLVMILLLGLVVPNPFEYVLLQLIAGFVALITAKQLYKRANLFLSLGQVFLAYSLSYTAVVFIQEGKLERMEYIYFGLFALNSILTFLALLLIWVYEKLFKLVSDLTLLELSNTHNPLLRDLSEKAPGTFQHVLQVANLAEAAANEIGANALLVRTGALYHDIGKMLRPKYFTENQQSSVSAHDELEPEESAQLIIGHVIEGIALAKKHKLPDIIIDFIRTHHGTNLVYYFYKKAQDQAIDSLNPEDFMYPGPIPYSKETALLMMCDSVEAASKSLSNPTVYQIDTLVEKIIDKQLEDRQFENAPITLREIAQVKQVLKKKLKNMFHLRIAYPE